jgi:D-methionine transport system ATP-binding protein
MGVIREVCEEVAVLDEGRIVEQGSVTEIFNAPKTVAAKELVYA